MRHELDSPRGTKETHVFALSVADHQQLKASPAERPQWATVGAVSAIAFAAAALLVSLTLRVHSIYARKLQVCSAFIILFYFAHAITFARSYLFCPMQLPVHLDKLKKYFILFTAFCQF